MSADRGEIDLRRARIQPAGHWDWHVPTPFSQGWRVGPLLFTGGQLSADADGEVIGRGDIALQTANVFDALSRVLEEGGATWRDVVKMNTYYVFDGRPEQVQPFWEAMTEVRLRYLPDPGPAATAVRVAGLMYDGFLIEVEAIAVVGSGERIVDLTSLAFPSPQPPTANEHDQGDER
ncbi:MAG: Rid family hydrolase [Solirubrobacterales bacterium]